MHLRNSKEEEFTIEVDSKMIYTSENNNKKYFAFSTLSEESKKNILDFYWKQIKDRLFFDIESIVENEIEIILYIFTNEKNEYLHGIGTYIRDSEWKDYSECLEFLNSELCLKII